MVDIQSQEPKTVLGSSMGKVTIKVTAFTLSQFMSLLYFAFVSIQ